MANLPKKIAKTSLLKKWVKALRSGEYKQRKYSLGYENTYCCLGVLCKLEKIQFNEINSLDQNSSDRIGNTKTYLQLSKLLGVATSHYLASMNDAGASFNDIADVIEDRYIKGNV